MPTIGSLAAAAASVAGIEIFEMRLRDATQRGRATETRLRDATQRGRAAETRLRDATQRGRATETRLRDATQWEAGAELATLSRTNFIQTSCVLQLVWPEELQNAARLARVMSVNRIKRETVGGCLKATGPRTFSPTVVPASLSGRCTQVAMSTPATVKRESPPQRTHIPSPEKFGTGVGQHSSVENRALPSTGIQVEHSRFF